MMSEPSERDCDLLQERGVKRERGHRRGGSICKSEEAVTAQIHVYCATNMMAHKINTKDEPKLNYACFHN